MVIKNHFIHEARRKQPDLVNHFMKVIERHRLSHAYLFSGEIGSGKLAVALTLAMRLFCLKVHDDLPCGHCEECMRITKAEHPDVLIIKPEGQKIRIHQIRFLETEFSKSAVEGDLRIFVIDHADRMTVSAANSLLKFIENPPGNVICFLLTDNLNLILPTIASRTQIIKFPSLPQGLFDQELKKAGIDSNQYNLISTMTNNLRMAQQWNRNDWFGRLQKAVEKWFQYLVHSNPMAFPFVQIQLLPLVNSQDEKKITLNLLIQIWRDVMDCKFMSINRSRMNFPQADREIKEAASRITTGNLLAIIDLMLSTNQMLNFNVNFRNILGTVTLRTLIKIRS